MWAVGANFEILRFDGESWRTGPAAPAGVTADLLAVGGSGQGDVYFVGRGGALGHLGSDGQIAMQTAPMASDLYAVWASGASDVYAVGVSVASAPPVTTISASPERISRAAVPIACDPAAQAETTP